MGGITVSEYEERRYHAAREAYRRDAKGTKPLAYYPTWADWWTAMHGNGESHSQYVSRKIREQADAKVQHVRD